MKPATSGRTPSGGFTLIETLVVMVISVGLVILMASLYRTVAHVALILKGGNPEWAVQTLLRNQLAHGLTLADQASLAGDGRELTLLSWHSRITGLEGKPVIAQYQFDPARRALTYREAPLPAWWGNTSLPALSKLAEDLRTVAPITLMGAVGSLDFKFIAADAGDLDPTRWKANWQQTVPPKLIVLHFTRTRDYTLWLELSSVEAS